MKYKSSKIYLILAVLCWFSIFSCFIKMVSAISDKNDSSFWITAFITSIIFTVLFSSLNCMSLKVEELSKEIELLKSKQEK